MVEIGVLVVPCGPDKRPVTEDNLVSLDTFLIEANLIKVVKFDKLNMRLL